MLDTLAYGHAVGEALWTADITGRGMALVHNLRNALRQAVPTPSEKEFQALFVRGLGGEEVALLRTSESQLVPVAQFARSLKSSGLLQSGSARRCEPTAVVVGDSSCVPAKPCPLPFRPLTRVIRGQGLGGRVRGRRVHRGGRRWA